MLVVVAIIGVLIGLLLPAVQSARESARRSRCLSNLRQVGLGFHLHHDATRRLPAATAFGSSYASAFTQILPYIEETASAQQYDKTKSALENADVVKQRISLFICPSMALRRNVPDITCDEVSAPASYAVCTGTGSAWDIPHNGAFVDETEPAVRFHTISDGVSKTLLAGELDYGLANYRRSMCQSNKTGMRWGSTAWGFGYAGFSLASVFGVYNAERLINGNDEYQTFRSDHPGGCGFTMADGSTRFVEDSVERSVLQAVASRAGGESVTLP
ncbi:MAG: DUF1559 domain-containing protein [Pirellulales bacterium]